MQAYHFSEFNIANVSIVYRKSFVWSGMNCSVLIICEIELFLPLFLGYSKSSRSSDRSS